MPRLTSPTAGILAERAGVKLPVDSTRDASQLIDHLLNKDRDMLGATQAIAHGLPQRDGIKWAVNACRRVETKLPPEHRNAITAADAFVAAPNLATRANAAAVAERIGNQSPAGLAAQAASMADVADGPKVPGADQLVPTCVVGAVAGAVALSPKSAKFPDRPTVPGPQAPAVDAAKIAALIPPGPNSPEAARNAAAFKPFIDDGLALAARPAAGNS